MRCAIKSMQNNNNNPKNQCEKFILDYKPIWEEYSAKMNELLATENPSTKTLVDIINVSVAIRKGTDTFKDIVAIMKANRQMEAFMKNSGVWDKYQELLASAQAKSQTKGE